MKDFRFTLKTKDKHTSARVGVIHTPHGDIETPAFVPVGTQATVKSLTPDDLEMLGVHLFFVNTYHAYLRPGLAVIRKFGSLHRFMNWQRPIITDSGGFQVFSLGTKKFVNAALSEVAVTDRARFTRKQSKAEDEKIQVYPDDYKPVGQLVRIDQDGVTFTSHWDGSEHRFTPERSMEIQWELGSDIHIAFDECAPYPTTQQYAKSAMERTHQWAVRSLAAHERLRKAGESLGGPYQALYGVVQGSVYEPLRKESARFVGAMDVDGIAIGGVSVGESKQEMVSVMDWVTPLLPEGKPRHLLGVGEVDDIFAAVEHGIDTFDCVQPTRLARVGTILVKNSLMSSPSNPAKRHEIDITKKVYAEDTEPPESDCPCYTCAHFSRAYLHHLFRVRELLAYRLASIHNLHFVLQLTQSIRTSIQSGEFLDLKNQWLYNRE